MRVLISGATGLIGRALCVALRGTPGVSVATLSRGPAAASAGQAISWDPARGFIDARACDGFDAVVHLAGESIAGSGPLAPITARWGARKKHEILESRRRGTALLATTLAASRAPPRVFVCASGVGFYGTNGAGDGACTEATPQGRGFLADVSGVWEGAAAPASAAGVRVVNLRFGVVLSARGGLVAQLRPPFLACLGGRVGDGTQWLSWIALDDAVRAIRHAIACGELTGPVNACAPAPVRNADAMAALAAALHRPCLVPLPSLAVKAIFGEMGDELLLGGQRAVPEKLLTSGFVFKHPEIVDAMQWAVNDA